ncbi:Uncharacterized protein HZ326_29515 [Fusarium oxysporum f. sp. albedinis]|nr:Uncharacterized protein HZ326_29515 [Fusarium oxysporum f. sp. albedinis]
MNPPLPRPEPAKLLLARFWAARQDCLVGHFLFSAKFICMGKQKNRLTATKPQNHFARIFSKVHIPAISTKANPMVVVPSSFEVRGGRERRLKLATG